MTGYATVRLERDGGNATLTLARTGMHNALVPEFLDRILDALQCVATDDSCRAVLLCSQAPAFSIGGDMRRFQREGHGDLRAYSDELVGKLNQVILALLGLPQPVLAAVDGVVTGGSIGLVLASDLVFLSPRAVFKAHYATAGFCPDGGWTALLPRIAGQRQAAAALYLNRSIRAEEAVLCGLAHELVSEDQLLTVATAAAQKIAAYPRGTMMAAKRLLNRDREEIAMALEAERISFLDLIGKAEAANGIDDFLLRFADYPQGE